MINECINGGKAKTKASSKHGSANKIVAALICLQVLFAVYATFLLYFMSPSIDISAKAKPDFSWATRIAQQWKQLMIKPHVINHQQEASSSSASSIKVQVVQTIAPISQVSVFACLE